MKEDLTAVQASVLEFLEEREDAGQGAPTVREICQRFQYRSTKAAFDHLRALEAKGWITRNPRYPRCSRSIRLLRSRRGIPLLGAIPAGSPWESEAAVETRLPIEPAFFGIKDPRKAFALRVKEDSMLGRNLIDGDLVVIEHGADPKDNDIVAALIDNQTTLKTLVFRDGAARLKAENPLRQAPEPAWGFEIQGVVRGMLREV